MGNHAKVAKDGYICPVRGCKKKKNRMFTAIGLTMHILTMHGIAEFEKRMRVEYKNKW